MRRVEDKVLEKEAAFAMDPTEVNKSEICTTKQELDERLKLEEIFWRQKAYIKWIKEDYMNTRYFHQSVKQRKLKLHIHQIMGLNG